MFSITLIKDNLNLNIVNQENENILMQEYTFCDEIGSCDAPIYLAFIVDGKIIPFNGHSIDKICEISSSKYKKNGKWSNTTYDLLIADNVGIFEYRRPMHNQSFFDIHCWDELLSFIINNTHTYVDMNELQLYIHTTFPKVGLRLDNIEQKIPELMVDEKIVFTFGSPSNKSIQNGFWTNPKEIPNHNGSVSLIDPEKGWIKENIEIPDDLYLLSVNRQSGYHGGYVTITLCPKNNNNNMEE